mgnify:CR=1 FL=1
MGQPWGPQVWVNPYKYEDDWSEEGNSIILSASSRRVEFVQVEAL